MSTILKTQFKAMVNLDVRDEVEQDYKGLNYLSWATAYQLMMEQDPSASYRVLKASDGLPFFTRDGVHMVFTEVTMFDVTKEMWLPVMDNKHNAVEMPTSRQVSDCIMRCLVKNIAMFGIGLRLYKKEGLEEFQADDAVLNLIGKLMMQLGLSKEELEKLSIQTCGKDNIRALTQDEAEDLVQTLKEMRNKRKLNENPDQPSNKVEEKVKPINKAEKPAPAVTPAQAVPSVEVEVEAKQDVPTPAPVTGDLLTAEQLQEITALYAEKKLTKIQLKEHILNVAPTAKGVRTLTPDQADKVIENLKAIA